jgi:hypothetical protein
MEFNSNRRSYIRKAAFSGLMAVSIPEILSASLTPLKSQANPAYALRL